MSRAQDYLIAKRVMGYWTEYYPYHHQVYWFELHSSLPGEKMYAAVAHDYRIKKWSDGLPRFSSDLLAAQVIIGKIFSLGFTARYKFLKTLKDLAPLAGKARIDPFWAFLFYMDVPDAVCKAALVAVENREGFL